MNNRILLLSLCMMFCISTYAGKKFVVQYDNGIGLVFEILSKTDMTVMVVEGNWAAKQVEELTIPGIVDYLGQKYWVTQLDRRLCWGWAKLRKVNLPSSIRVIGESAFQDCTELRDINLPDGLAIIGKEAFDNTNIASLYIPNTVMKIEKNAFHNSLGIYSVITNVPDYITFENCVKFGITRERLQSYYNHRSANKQKKDQSTNSSSANLAVNVKEKKVVQNTPVTKNNHSVNVDKTEDNFISDVDNLDTKTTAKNELAFAVIFANEKYKYVDSVAYAQNDGVVFHKYCHDVLGIPSDQMRLKINATIGEMKGQIEWLTKVARVYKGEAKIIVYYAGHGVPNEKDHSAYLLPTDHSGNNPTPTTAYSINELYNELGALNAKSVTLFIDACFSGYKRGDSSLLSKARGMAMAYKTGIPQGNLVVFSAAQGEEAAYSYQDQKHGLFTYYLLKKLKDSKGEVDYGTLGDYIEQEVSRKAIKKGKEQTPTVAFSEKLGKKWRDMKLK